MVNASHTSFTATDRSYLASAKKELHKMAVQAGFEQKRINEIDLLVSELASNLVKHASGGEILAGIVQTGRGAALEIIGIDNGPGIAEPQKMLQDGVSTTRTLGHGLGSIRRFADEFELYTQKDWGTIVLSRIYQKGPPKKDLAKPLLLHRALVIAKPGEISSGDGCYSFTAGDGSFRLLVADGLGHGPEANHAVREAALAFKEIKSDSPAEILRLLHAAIKKTRGAVATVVIADPVRKIWKLCGIGNISTRFSGFLQSKSYLAYNGIVGHNIPGTLNDQEIPQSDFHQITLCSDGIRSRWEHARLPDIGKQDLMIQAAALYKDFARKTDDMSVIIGKIYA